MSKKKEAKSYVKSTEKRSKQEVIELQEAEEGKSMLNETYSFDLLTVAL
jgi:ribosomal protein L7/L12